MERQQEDCEWHAILEEAEELVNLQKRKQNSLNPSEIFESRRISQQGTRWRSRFKFPFQQFPKDEGLVCAYSLKDRACNSCEEDIEVPADVDVFEHRDSDNTEAQFCEDVVEDGAEVASRLGFHEQRSEAPSVSELLENLQNTNNLSYRSNFVASKLLDNINGKVRQMSSSKRTPLHLGDRVLDIEDTSKFKDQFEKGKTILDNCKGKAKSKHTQLHLVDRVLDIEDPLELMGADSSDDDKYADKGSQTNQFDKGKKSLDNSEGKERPKRTHSYLGDRVLDGEDPLEFISADSFGNDQYTDQICRADQFDKGKTMLDLFQDAFNTTTEGAAFHSSNKFGCGYHGRLQEVMQLEKERDMDYLKQLQAGRKPSNESQCIDVRILSRVLEAKLTVCQCLLGENSKNSNSGGTTKKTIIFCPRICSNMELEVGNMVRVHPPWKEVEVKGWEIIILCKYFSRIVI